MVFENDIDTFFDTDGFAEDATWTHGATKTPVSVIFDAPGTVVTIGAVSTYIERPQVKVKTSDVIGISNADSITVRSTVYKVVIPTPDGTGITTVVLAEGKR